ncbi:aerotaxis receptor [Persephonella hydrogeniphila]|uniref:Aerotaxis receptor n=1 Tax=Persephonella hydrogeniphila TaxID=198703 RepID=A0A285NAB0_9AQUI|nr:PAS domain-containing methyl-accepting chemotaxis protein [Persephonella hydrogeniphila]SNZ06258.1 aerotaxis receptor [Persephonella hydrogeniphila]
MGRNRPQPINRESEFRPEEIFFSSTDLKGIILSGNDVFQRVSKYSMDELIGSPHNIIRHPDMPKIVFKLLWDYIQSGKVIVAYVKNMAKDGSYYWVLATVFPVRNKEGDIVEYLSIRIKPTTENLDKVSKLYELLLQAEKEGGMEASFSLLMDTLKKLGYDSYDDFMKDIFIAEMKDKSDILQIKINPDFFVLEESSLYIKDILKKLKNLETATKGFFSLLSHFEYIDNLFSQKSEKIFSITNEIRLTALNSSIESLRLGSEGAVFSVISYEMRKNSEEENKIIGQMKGHIERLSKEIKEIIFNVFLSKLQIIMFADFLNSKTEHINGCIQDEIKKDIKNFLYLISASYQNFTELSSVFSESLDSINRLKKMLGKLRTLIEELEAIYFRGLIEAGYYSGSNFQNIFNHVKSLVSQTKYDIMSIEEPLSGLVEKEHLLQDALEGIIRNLSDIRYDLEAITN